MRRRMRHRITRLFTAGLVLLLPLALVSCRATGGDDQAEEDTGGLKTGPGVTDDSITLGVLLDLTVVFGPLGNSLAQGIQLYWDQVNQDGGVCDRQVEVDVRDHRYDPQVASSLYREMAPNILGIQSLLGSPIVSALTPAIEQDGMFVGLAAWTSEVLPNPLIWITGTTYDIEAITGIEFLMQNEGIKAGDKIGHIYFEGDFGGNALRGSQYMAEQEGLTIVPQEITAQDTDLSAQVAVLKREGVKAILLSTGPTQMASLAGVAHSVGLDVPIMSNAPGFTPQLLDTAAGAAIEANAYVVSGIAPFAHDAPGVKEAAAAFEEAYPDEIPTQGGFMFGYAQSVIAKAVLERACENQDLTREGLVEALHQISDLDTGGMVAGPLDYTDPSKPPTNSVYIAKADSSVPGGLSVVETMESDAAAGYEFPS